MGRQRLWACGPGAWRRSGKRGKGGGAQGESIPHLDLGRGAARWRRLGGQRRRVGKLGAAALQGERRASGGGRVCGGGERDGDAYL